MSKDEIRAIVEQYACYNDGCIDKIVDALHRKMVKEIVSALNANRPVENRPLDNDFNMGYKVCCEWQNVKTDNRIAELRRELE